MRYTDTALNQTATLTWAASATRLFTSVATAGGVTGTIVPADLFNFKVPDNADYFALRFVCTVASGAAPVAYVATTNIQLWMLPADGSNFTDAVQPIRIVKDSGRTHGPWFPTIAGSGWAGHAFDLDAVANDYMFATTTSLKQTHLFPISSFPGDLCIGAIGRIGCLLSATPSANVTGTLLMTVTPMWGNYSQRDSSS